MHACFHGDLTLQLPEPWPALASAPLSPELATPLVLKSPTATMDTVIIPVLPLLSTWGPRPSGSALSPHGACSLEQPAPWGHTGETWRGRDPCPGPAGARVGSEFTCPSLCLLPLCPAQQAPSPQRPGWERRSLTPSSVPSLLALSCPGPRIPESGTIQPRPWAAAKTQSMLGLALLHPTDLGSASGLRAASSRTFWGH